MGRPFPSVAIVGAYNTRQARALEGETTFSILADAMLGAIRDAGLTPGDVNGITVNALDPGIVSSNFIPYLGGQPCWTGNFVSSGIGALMEAALAIEAGLCDVAVLAAGQAGAHRAHQATAPWTRPEHEFTAPFGFYTAVEFALPAKRHMHLYGTTQAQLAAVSATIRNHGSATKGAVFEGRGPFSIDDILASRPICDPFHLLDCSCTSEGGAAIVLARRDRIGECAKRPVFLLGGGVEALAQGYTRAPVWDECGAVGAWAARRAFAMAGLSPHDVDVCEFYDSFSFEVIRQFEAYGFCKLGEGGDFVSDGRIGLEGAYPTATNGGTMAFSHAGTAQLIQKILAAVFQLRGEAGATQVRGAEVAMATNSGSGALCADVLLLGAEPA